MNTRVVVPKDRLSTQNCTTFEKGPIIVSKGNPKQEDMRHNPHPRPSVKATTHKLPNKKTWPIHIVISL